MATRTWALACALVLLALLAPDAWAQPDPDKDRARSLAQEAVDLLEAKRYQDALDRVTQAEALYHAPFHLLMMAQAEEGLGRVAEAAATYERLVAEPLPSSAPALFRDAQEKGKQRLRELLARVPSLLVRVSGAPALRVTATIDGKPLEVGSGAAKLFDPGEHKVEVVADGYRPFERTVTLPAKGGVVIVDAPLERLGASSVEGPRPVQGGDARTEAKRPGSIVPAAIAFGFGGVMAVVGTATGILSLNKTGELKIRCPNNQCAASDQPDLDSAHALATGSTVSFAFAGAGVAAGVVLLLVRPGGTVGPKAQASRVPDPVRISPWIGAGSAGVAGAF